MQKAEQRRSLAPAAPASEPRGGGFRAVGIAVVKLAAPIIEKRGGHLARLKAAWPAVAGADWSVSAWPAALGRDGALKLLVVPAAALELQHRGPLLVERVNLFLGGAVVTRLVLVQGLPPRAAIGAAAPPRQLTADEAAALEQTLCRIADPELRTALGGLGRAVLGGQASAAPVGSASTSSSIPIPKFASI
jgi:hypothetical protein